MKNTLKNLTIIAETLIVGVSLERVQRRLIRMQEQDGASFHSWIATLDGVVVAARKQFQEAAAELLEDKDTVTPKKTKPAANPAIFKAGAF